MVVVGKGDTVMRKGWRRTWRILGVLVGLIVVAGVVLYAIGGVRLAKTNDLTAESILVPDDAESLARGRELTTTALCTECHGSDLSGGDDLVEDPAVGTIFPPNLTGLADSFSDGDYVRAIRHAVGPDGRQLMIMPAELYVNLSAEDLGAIIGYLKTLPRVGEDTPPPDITFMGKVLLAAGMFGDVFPAEVIDHDTPFPDMPQVIASVEYGSYFGQICMACHGEDLAGAPIDPSDPASPLAPNLTSAGSLAGWTASDFTAAVRNGITPDGRVLDSEFMPWDNFSELGDDEIEGLWLFVQSMPPVTPDS